MIAIALLFFYNVNAQKLNVLFVGNSYTSTNNLPELLKNLAQDNQISLSYNCFTAGASRFMKHWENEQLQHEIASGRYDVLVLQGQSQEVAFPYGQFMDEVYPYAYKLDSLFKANNPNGRVVYFMTWGYRYGDAMNCPFYSPFCAYETMSDELCTNYSMMASDFQSELSPIGSAWLHLFMQDSLSFDLHSADNSHPNLKGSYFSACVLYTTLFKNQIQSSFTAGLPSDTAQYFQQWANKLFTDYDFADCQFTSSMPQDTSSLQSVDNADVNVFYDAFVQALHISSAKNRNISKVELYNLNGVKVKETFNNADTHMVLPVNELNTGYYVAKIYFGQTAISYGFIKK